MIMVRFFLEMMLNPFFLCVAFIGVLLFLKSNYGLRWGMFLVFLSFLVISTGWLPRYVTLKLEEQYPLIKEVDPKVHWVVVLSGGACEVEGMPVNNNLKGTTLKRLLEGVRLYRHLPGAKLLLSGGGGYGHILPEAKYLGIIASWFAIPKKDIALETISNNTADEARAIKPIVKSEPFYLVTSATHMPRSMRLFEAQGLHPIAAPTDYTCFWEKTRWERVMIPNAYNLMQLSVAMHEYLGLLWSRLHHDYAS